MDKEKTLGGCWDVKKMSTEGGFCCSVNICCAVVQCTVTVSAVWERSCTFSQVRRCWPLARGLSRRAWNNFEFLYPVTSSSRALTASTFGEKSRSVISCSKHLSYMLSVKVNIYCYSFLHIWDICLLLTIMSLGRYSLILPLDKMH